MAHTLGSRARMVCAPRHLQFDRFDGDRSGRIDYDEFVGAIRDAQDRGFHKHH